MLWVLWFVWRGSLLRRLVVGDRIEGRLVIEVRRSPLLCKRAQRWWAGLLLLGLWTGRRERVIRSGRHGLQCVILCLVCSPRIVATCLRCRRARLLWLLLLKLIAKPVLLLSIWNVQAVKSSLLWLDCRLRLNVTWLLLLEL